MNLPTNPPPFVHGDALLQTYLNLTVEKPSKNGNHNGATPQGGSSVYGKKALKEECQRVSDAPEGSRNDQLNTSAFVLGQLVAGGELDRATVENTLYKAAVEAGLEESEIMPTIHSGMGKGESDPRSAPEGYDGFGAETPDGWEAAGVARPSIIVNNRQMDAVGFDGLNAILFSSPNERYPTLYSRRTELVRILLADGITQTLNPSILRAMLARSATWLRVSKQGKETVASDTFPPKDIAEYIISLGEWDDVAPLRGIVASPALTPSGAWLTDPGYDNDSGLFLLEGTTLGDTDPTEEHIKWAREMLLTELLGDFPFADTASKTHAVALLLLGFVRHYIKGPTPLHLVDAPTPGTGKGLLVETCVIPSVRDGVASVAGAGDDAEWRKRITTILQEGSTHINLDNLAGILDAPSLALATTQPIWKDRRLGYNDSVTIPIQIIWTATANNLTPSDEMARRCLWIRLDANTERPQDRDGWRHDPLIPWAKERRNDLATAAVILIRNWQLQGMPRGKRRKGSYEEWSFVMGGILEANGFESFLGNETAFYETAASSAQMIKAFVEQWYRKHEKNYVTVGELMPLANQTTHTDPTGIETIVGMGILVDMLGSGNEQSRKTKLGMILKEMADRTFTIIDADDDSIALKIQKNPKLYNGSIRWHLLEVDLVTNDDSSEEDWI